MPIGGESRTGTGDKVVYDGNHQQGPQLPVFHLIFGCLLYPIWRLVDTLVKCLLGDERTETRVRASTFLTIAKEIRTRIAKIIA